MSLIRSFPGLSIEDTKQYSSELRNFRSGGSLSDKLKLEDRKLQNKIILKNLDYKQKKALEETKEVIKSISKNNELLRKSLIKIFK
jgi:hypothetical protein